MINKFKSYCTIHHLYFYGNYCPLCMEEKCKNTAKRYQKKKNDNNKKQTEIIDDLISKLQNHFN